MSLLLLGVMMEAMNNGVVPPNAKRKRGLAERRKQPQCHTASSTYNASTPVYLSPKKRTRFCSRLGPGLVSAEADMSVSRPMQGSVMALHAFTGNTPPHRLHRDPRRNMTG